MKLLVYFGLTLTTVVVAAAYTNVERGIPVSNATEKKIAKVLVSSNGETYSAVSLPNGIKPGQTLVVEWERNESDCHWTLKAEYADRSESEPRRVNVCESNVTVRFE